MLLHPNCKINIGLRVTRKREDGYHDLETIFYPVYDLHDDLEVCLAEDLGVAKGSLRGRQGVARGSSVGRPWVARGLTDTFLQEGIAVDCPPESNLILRCLNMFRDEFGDRILPLHIRFRKNIPFGAGLGGGSSDAAHMAIALNELFHLQLTKSELASRVAKLGADCPFFIYNTPCFAEGIGDILSPIDFDLSAYRLMMIKPEVGVSTRDAYAGIIPSGSHREDFLFTRSTSGLSSATHSITPTTLTPLINDFETTVFAKHPQLADIKKRLLDAGAVYAAMSGSGSTIFGLFENNTERGTNAYLRGLEQEFASMIIFHDTLAQAQS